MDPLTRQAPAAPPVPGYILLAVTVFQAESRPLVRAFRAKVLAWSGVKPTRVVPTVGTPPLSRSTRRSISCAGVYTYSSPRHDSICGPRSCTRALTVLHHYLLLANSIPRMWQRREGIPSWIEVYMFHTSIIANI